MTELFIYQKTFKKTDGSKFKQTFASMNVQNGTFKCFFTEDVKNAIIKSDIPYPFTLTLEDGVDYYPKRDKTGRYVLVIVGFKEIKKAEFTQKTLQDIIKEREATKESGVTEG